MAYRIAVGYRNPYRLSGRQRSINPRHMHTHTRDMPGKQAGTPDVRPALPVLTGLRFVAAFGVLLGHSLTTIFAFAEVPYGPIYWLGEASGVGMSLFFVLSGFVIHYNYALQVTRGGAGGKIGYLWARFARLYPLFIFTLFINILLSRRFVDFWAGEPQGLGGLLRALPYYLVFAHSWLYVPIDNVPLSSAIGGGSPVTWSISTEWFFYLVFPFIAIFVLRIRRAMWTFTAALAWCAAFAAIAAYIFDRQLEIDAWAAQHFGSFASAANDLQNSYFRWLLYFSPYLRVGEFILGCLTAQLYLQLRKEPISRYEQMMGKTILALAVASIPLIKYLMHDPAWSAGLFRKLNMNFGMAPSLAIIIFCAARYRTTLSRVLSARPVTALGDASYSIYLIHSVVLLIADHFGGGMAPVDLSHIAWAFAKLVTLITIILIMSLFSYAYIEVPSRQWLRSLAGRTSTASSRGRAVIVAICPVLLALILVAGRGRITAVLNSLSLGISTTYHAACTLDPASASPPTQAACNVLDTLGHVLRHRASDEER